MCQPARCNELAFSCGGSDKIALWTSQRVPRSVPYLRLLLRQIEENAPTHSVFMFFAIVAQLRRFILDFRLRSLDTYLLNHSVFDMGSPIWRGSHADQHVFPRSQIGLKEDVHPGRDHCDTTRQ